MTTPGPDHTYYSPSEVGQEIGLSKRRILQMLERGELAGTKDPQNGRWLIPEAHVAELRERREREQQKKPPPPPQEGPESRELVDTLKGQVEDLRQRLDLEQEANRENRRIIAALTSRVPAIEAPETVEEGPKRDQPRSGASGPQEGVQRPWWRRLLGN